MDGLLKLSFSRCGVVGLVLQAALYAQSNSANVPAQTDSSEQQRFEVATIKPIKPFERTTPLRVGVTVYPGGRVVLSGLSLKQLVAAAFDVPLGQISGGERWMDDEIYVVEAKPDAVGVSRVKTIRHGLFDIEDEYLRKLLQVLLVDRFQLKFHRDSLAGHVFELKRSGGPLRMNAAEEPAAAAGENNAASIGFARARWVLAKTSMSQLAKFASAYIIRAPVLDRTGLTGCFDYWQPPGSEPEPDYRDSSASFMNLLKEIGLKLERVEGLIETLAIDGAARPSAD
jgi:uncharacterized protein (TIGR03435 family)